MMVKTQYMVTLVERCDALDDVTDAESLERSLTEEYEENGSTVMVSQVGKPVVIAEKVEA